VEDWDLAEKVISYVFHHDCEAHARACCKQA